MTQLFRGLSWAVIALACIAGYAHAQTRPLAVDDIVSTEAFGRASISPSGRWALYEKRGPYDTAPRFDLGPRSQWAISDLWLIDLEQPASEPERLLPNEDLGIVRGPWSPTGTRLLVYRLRGDRLEAGIVRLSDRSVTWTGLTPDIPATGAAAEWVSDDQVALVIRPDHSLPWLLRYYSGSQDETRAAWRRTADGRTPSRTVIDASAGTATPERSSIERHLVVLDVETASQRILARGEISDFALSPDGARVAVITGAELSPIEQDRIVQMAVPFRQRLHIIDRRDGTARLLRQPLDVAPHLLRWSTDSRSLLVWARQDGLAWREGNLTSVSADGSFAIFSHVGLDIRPQGEDIDTLRGVQADWIGEVPILLARRPDTSRFDWYALSPDGQPEILTADLETAPARLALRSKDAVYHFADSAFWVTDAIGTGRLTPKDIKVEEVVIGDAETPFRLRMNAAPARDWATAMGSGDTLTVTTTGAVRRRTARPTEGPRRVLASSETQALVIRNEGLVETLSLRTEGGERDIDQVNARLANVSPTRPIAVAHADAFGRPTQSWLFLPGHLAVKDVKGLVIEVYPGSIDSGAWSGPLTLTYGLRAAVLAGGGYAVLSPSIPIDRPGSTSPDFYLRSVDAAADAALAAYPALPRDRVAVVGHSLGGYVALAIAARSSRYQSYVAWAGLTDMFGHWGEFTPVTRILPEGGHMMRNQQGWVENSQGGMEGPP